VTGIIAITTAGIQFAVVASRMEVFPFGGSAASSLWPELKNRYGDEGVAVIPLANWDTTSRIPSLTLSQGGLRLGRRGEPTGFAWKSVAKAERVAQERGRPVEPDPGNAGEGMFKPSKAFLESYL